LEFQIVMEQNEPPKQKKSRKGNSSVSVLFGDADEGDDYSSGSDEGSERCGEIRDFPAPETGSFVVFRNDQTYHRMGMLSVDSAKLDPPVRIQPPKTAKISQQPSKKKGRSFTQRKKYPQHDSNKSKTSSTTWKKKQTQTPSSFERKVVAFFVIDPRISIEDSSQLDINHRFEIPQTLNIVLPQVVVTQVCEYLFDEAQSLSFRQEFRRRGEKIFIDRSQLED